MLAGGDYAEKWRLFKADIEERLTRIHAYERETVQYSIDLPDRPRYELKTHLTQLREQYRADKPGAMFWLFKGRKIKYLKDAPIVNGQPFQNAEEVNAALNDVLMREETETLLTVWHKFVADVEGPTFRADEPRLLVRIQQMLQDIDTTLALAASIEELRTLASGSNLNLPGSFKWHRLGDLEQLQRAVTALGDDLRFTALREASQETFDRLQLASQQDHAHPLWQKFSHAYKERSVATWNKLHETLAEQTATQRDVQRFFDLLEKLSETAPLLEEDVRQSLGEAWAFPVDYTEAWQYKQLATWMAQLDRYRPEKIQQRIVELRKREQELVEQIVADLTWKQQIEQISEGEKRSLQAWKQKIKRIGKGIGRYADKYRKQARREMAGAQTAIPVWIMPINRVIENFAVDGKKFDVVIVDESSQCDIFSLLVLMRAEKAVIVGDDEQISPYAVGVNQEEVNELNRRFLQNIPRRDILDMKTSLFELSDQIFPKNARLMLKEHFRSVPEIIQFSNDLCYDGSMIPLRLPNAAERVDNPVVAKRVPGYCEQGKTINVVEAEAIAADIEAMIADSRYDGQSMGIISLQGNDQAKVIEEKVREAIGEAEMVKRHIICGDAYAFQGDERDIIFMSLVVADNRRFRAMTDVKSRQRFNVAASRARNQMSLYHSVTLDDLNPKDMRYRLLNYCQHPTRSLEAYEDVAVMLESPFEKEVARRIIARGYHVTPQLKVGKYRIDMVVEGLHNRLAVECDGDRWHGIERWAEDNERQYVLERAGWTFWRVRGSAFYRDPDAAMASLWRQLDEMRIEPARVQATVG
ncbi:AAA domain-containing protein [Numidum massiliense]|uniref:AAA domain-containing protein n=1 Tax=Numidum massiliense TaxID=1522315 RepID=UPI0006D53539|nr:AAA domain-containing protein [Numidum massiliense]